MIFNNKILKKSINMGHPIARLGCLTLSMLSVLKAVAAAVEKQAKGRRSTPCKKLVAFK